MLAGLHTAQSMWEEGSVLQLAPASCSSETAEVATEKGSSSAYFSGQCHSHIFLGSQKNLKVKKK